MILRGATPQSLTRRGLVLLAGLGLVLLPFLPTLAQQPGDTPADRQRAADFLKAISQEQATDELLRATGRLAELAQAGQVPTDQAQRELEDRRALLQKQLEQLHLAIEQLKQAAKAAAKAGAKAPQPNQPQARSGSGMPGGYCPPAKALVTAGGGKGSVEQRLEQVERKLDILLWEIANLRREMGKGHSASGMTPPGMAPPMPAGPGGYVIGPANAPVPAGSGPRPPQAAPPPTLDLAPPGVPRQEAPPFGPGPGGPPGRGSSSSSATSSSTPPAAP